MYGANFKLYFSDSLIFDSYSPITKESLIAENDIEIIQTTYVTINDEVRRNYYQKTAQELYI